MIRGRELRLFSLEKRKLRVFFFFIYIKIWRVIQTYIDRGISILPVVHFYFDWIFFLFLVEGIDQRKCLVFSFLFMAATDTQSTPTFMLVQKNCGKNNTLKTFQYFHFYCHIIKQSIIFILFYKLENTWIIQQL